jgi:hypothetical protein
VPFSSQFKTGLAALHRFTTLGELVYATARAIWEYTTFGSIWRLKMPPKRFAELHKNLVQTILKKKGA